MWPLTPYTRDNGATLVWPDSHGARALEPGTRLVRKSPSRWSPARRCSSSARPCTAPAPTAATRSGAAAIVSYCLGWLKPYENQWLAYPPEVARTSRPSSPPWSATASTARTSAIMRASAPRSCLRTIRRPTLGAIDALRPDQAAGGRRDVAQQRVPAGGMSESRQRGGHEPRRHLRARLSGAQGAARERAVRRRATISSPRRSATSSTRASRPCATRSTAWSASGWSKRPATTASGCRADRGGAARSLSAGTAGCLSWPLGAAHPRGQRSWAPGAPKRRTWRPSWRPICSA